MTYRFRAMVAACRVALVAAVLLGANALACAGEAEFQPALRDFAARLPAVRAAMPAIVESATAAAQRILDQPGTLLNIPYWQQQTFSEELLNRAGGLAHALPTLARKKQATERDVVLMSVRSWALVDEKTARQLRDWADGPQMLILIADAAGMPEDLQPQYVIDVGRVPPDDESGRINVLVNVTIGWMWCCEYVAAMTRQGRIPGILISIAWAHADAHNKPIQTPEGRHATFPCDTPIEAGALSMLYLKRVDELIADLKSSARQQQIDNAATVITDYLAQGKKVGVSGVGHVIIDEAKRDLQSPMIGFQAVNLHKRAFKEKLEPGDLLVWIGYMGMDSAYVQFSKYIAEAQLDLITSCIAWPPEDYGGPQMIDHIPDMPPTKAHIDQSWLIGDAEVPIPGNPPRMAPISGLNAGLILRMIDDAVAEKIKATTKARREEEGHEAEP